MLIDDQELADHVGDVDTDDYSDNLSKHLWAPEADKQKVKFVLSFHDIMYFLLGYIFQNGWKKRFRNS